MSRYGERRGLRQFLVQGSLVAAVNGIPRTSAAQHLNLSYEADQSCPDRDAFERKVRLKIAEFQSEATAEHDAAISLRLSATETGFWGQLKLQRVASHSDEREVTGASCSEVADALAFVLALALSTKDPLPPATSPPLAAAPASRRVSEPRRERDRPNWRWGGGVQIGVHGGVAPVLPVAEALFLVAQRPSAGPFGLALRLSFERAQPTSQLGSDATTQFSWWAGRFDACPMALHVQSRLTFLPCLGAHLGRISGSGRPVRGHPGDAAPIWSDAVGTGRVQLALLGSLLLEAQGDLIVPLSRYRFAFNRPDTDVYRVPSVAGAGFVGLLVLIP